MLNLLNKNIILGSSNGRISIFDLSNFRLARHLYGHTSNRSVNSIIFYENDKFISCADDNFIMIWSINSSNCLASINNSFVTNSLILTRDNTRLICGSDGGYIRIWNLENGSLVKNIDKIFVEIVAFEITNDDRLICVERGGVIKVINLINNNCEKIFKGHLKKVLSLKLLNENDFITCSRDGTVKHWKLDQVGDVKSFNVSQVHCSEFY